MAFSLRRAIYDTTQAVKQVPITGCLEPEECSQINWKNGKVLSAMTRCALLLLLTACMITCQQQASDGRLTVAFIPKSFTDPFWLDTIAGAERAARELGVELLVSSTKDETQVVEQVQIVENMILRGVDGIVLAPSDSDALVAAVLKANEAKIPVTAIDTGLSGGDTVTFAATDNRLCSTMAVDRFAARLGGKGKIAVVSCTQSIQTCRDLYSGFQARLEKHPGLDFVGAPMGVPFCDKTFDAVTDLLTAHPNLNGIYIFGGPSVLCGLKAAQAFGKELGEDFLMVGRSAIGNSGARDLEAVKRGELDALVVQFPDKMGFVGVESIVHFYQGTSSPEFVDTGVALVTRDNVDEFLAQIE